MNKTFIRLAAFLLVPCLVADPVTVGAFSTSPFQSTRLISSSVFDQQAVVAWLRESNRRGGDTLAAWQVRLHPRPGNPLHFVQDWEHEGAREPLLSHGIQGTNRRFISGPNSKVAPQMRNQRRFRRILNSEVEKQRSNDVRHVLSRLRGLTSQEALEKERGRLAARGEAVKKRLGIHPEDVSEKKPEPEARKISSHREAVQPPLNSLADKLKQAFADQQKNDALLESGPGLRSDGNSQKRGLGLQRWFHQRGGPDGTGSSEGRHMLDGQKPGRSTRVNGGPISMPALLVQLLEFFLYQPRGYEATLDELYHANAQRDYSRLAAFLRILHAAGFLESRTDSVTSKRRYYRLRGAVQERVDNLDFRSELLDLLGDYRTIIPKEKIETVRQAIQTLITRYPIVSDRGPLMMAPGFWWGQLYQATLRGSPHVRRWMRNPANRVFLSNLRIRYPVAWKLTRNTGTTRPLQDYIERQIAPIEETAIFLAPARDAFERLKETLPRQDALSAEIIQLMIRPFFDYMRESHQTFFIKGQIEAVSRTEHPGGYQVLMQKIQRLETNFQNRLRGDISPAHPLFDILFSQVLAAFTQDHIDEHTGTFGGDPMLIAIDSSRPDPAEPVDDRQFVIDHQYRLRELAERHEWVLRGHFLEGKTERVLAEERDISQPAVSQLLKTALDRLQELVESGKPSDLQFVRDHQDRLGELDEKYERALRGYYLEGKKLHVLAEEFQITPSNMSHFLQRALRQLHELVESGKPSDLQFVRDHQDRLSELGERYERVLRGYFLQAKNQHALAEELHISPAAVSQLVKTALRRLRELVESGKPSDLQFVRDHQDRLSELGERYERLLRGYFLEGKTQHALAEEFQVSQSDISQLIKRALTRLHELVESKGSTSPGQKSALGIDPTSRLGQWYARIPEGGAWLPVRLVAGGFFIPFAETLSYFTLRLPAVLQWLWRHYRQANAGRPEGNAKARYASNLWLDLGLAINALRDDFRQAHTRRLFVGTGRTPLTEETSESPEAWHNLQAQIGQLSDRIAKPFLLWLPLVPIVVVSGVVVAILGVVFHAPPEITQPFLKMTLLAMAIPTFHSGLIHAYNNSVAILSGSSQRPLAISPPVRSGKPETEMLLRQSA